GKLGTTHEMTRKMMIDSITYWVDEFKVDGVRVDLMGDLDAESVQIAYDEAKKFNPNLIMLGEGWRTFVGDGNDENEVMPADQDWMDHTDSASVFSDEIRNELKSGFGSEGEPRFLTGGARNIETIFNNIKGQPGNFVADDPGDVVQYIAAHDNLTLHDVIAQS
ncbi:alpha-amylase family glycosyl hydrolase, partial [Planococcus sp. SIMBA_143]